jgi:hypothetical protein
MKYQCPRCKLIVDLRMMSHICGVPCYGYEGYEDMELIALAPFKEAS